MHRETKVEDIYGFRNRNLPNTIGRKSHSTDNILVKERVKYIVNRNINDSNKLNLELLDYLRQTTWGLCRLSPIHNVDNREVTLKKYAARIKQALARNIHDVENNLSINAKIIEVDTNDSEEDDNCKTLQIEITQKKADKEEKTKYKGLILNWSSYRTNNNNPPLLLCNGTILVKRIVHKTLQEMFNTVISPFQITGDDIYWLCVLAGFSYRPKEKFLHLHYSPPGLNYIIKLQVPVRKVETLWNSLHSEDSDEITFEEIQNFKERLNEELFQGYNIRTNKLCLRKLVLPVVTLMTEGKVKFHDLDHIKNIIDFFQSTADILASVNHSVL